MNTKEQVFGWWIEISQDKINQPIYKHYSGVFKSYYEAELYKNQYIADLIHKNPKIVDIQIEQCQPKQPSIYINFFPICPWGFGGK